MTRVASLLLSLLLAACVSSPPPLHEPDLKEASRLNTRLGIDYMQKGRLELAREKLQRAVEQDDDNAVAHSFLAFIYSRRGEADKAERAYRRALAIDGRNPDTLNNFGIFLCEQGRREEAERYFMQAAQAPQYTRPEAALTNAGVCLRSQAPERAESYLREALRKNPKFPEALAQMAALSVARGEYLKARAFLQRYEAVAPHIAETLWLAIQTERQLGDAAAAARYARMLRESFPDSVEAQQLEKRS